MLREHALDLVPFFFFEIMRQESYSCYGDLSDEVCTVVDAIAQNDTSDPLNVVPSYVDWSEEGYTTEGEPLDGSATDAFPNGRASLLYNQWVDEAPKRYLDIYQAGATISAKDVPFLFSSLQHGAADLTRNVPRTPDLLTECSIIFQRPDGSQVVVERYQQLIN